MTDGYRVRAQAAALRVIRNDLDEGAALALLAFLQGSLSRRPREVGQPLDRALDGIWAAERAACTVIYAVDDEERTVTIVAVEPRRGQERVRPAR